MTNRCFYLILIFLFLICQVKAQNLTDIKEISPGVFKISSGIPETFTPYKFCSDKPLTESLSAMPTSEFPFKLESVRVDLTSRSCVVTIPLTQSEQIYGFGLQMNSFNQTGMKRTPVVNSYPLNDMGYTHAPVPMYVSTRGYAVLINTARYTTFYCGTLKEAENISASENRVKMNLSQSDELYNNKGPASGSVTVDIPHARGIEIFVFLGPDMKSAVERYNLFSGGGALPAIWGLGIKYRVKLDSKEENVFKTVRYFREKKIPCDVIGLEPRWQTASYSCSYVWNKENFPDPDKLTDSLRKMNFKLNLWEHAYIHPTSPIYNPLKNKAGNFLVWNGLVPDFADDNARKIFSDYHEENFVKKGISGFKLDECDNSDLTRAKQVWGFPEMSTFPSGIDGEQMHQVFGTLYARTINSIYKKYNLRTYLDYRASNAFASSLPASVYSDTYDHREYIRMISNSGFSGLLWSPELRESASETELARRLQTAILSAQTLVNSWYLQNPPWLQYNRTRNNNNEFLPNAEELEGIVRTLFNFRMSLIPYLYTSFAQYHFKGLPPFRALILDYPNDKNTENIFDEYMIGESILAAPLSGDSDTREIYLPEGAWYNFNTNERFEGGKKYRIQISLSQIPIFIKEGSIVPLAQPVEFVEQGKPFVIICKVYGKMASEAVLFEDDGNTYNFEKGDFNWVKLSWRDNKGKIERDGKYKKKLYNITGWEQIKAY
jgi:alpha-D-xyloside xylohydrolase